MIRNLIAVAMLLSALAPVRAQFQWNGPVNGTTDWSLGLWSPGVPPAGGSTAAALTFHQIGAAASYTAVNNLGNPFQLNTLNLNGLGGGITINGNGLAFNGSAQINQLGIGNAVISAPIELSPTVTTIGGGGTFGNLQLSGGISGSGAIAINRPQVLPYTGLIDFNAANTFDGGVTLTAGTLRVGNGSALGTGTLSFNGGSLTAFGNQVIGNPIAMNGDLRFAGFGNLTLTNSIGLSSANIVIGAQSLGRLTLFGASEHTGQTSIVVPPQIASNLPIAGSLVLSGPDGSINLSSRINLFGGGSLTLDNATAGNNNNRISGVASIVMSGGTFTLVGRGEGAGTNEDGGSLGGQGAVTVIVDASAVANTGTVLALDALVRQNRGQFVFLGNNANLGVGPGFNMPFLGFASAPALTNGIIPFAVAGVAGDDTRTELVTYGTSGVRLLAAGDYTTTITSGASNSANYKIASAQAITAPTQIGALVIETATPFTGSASTLTLATGTLLNKAAATIPSGMTLAFGASEANLFTNSLLTVDGVLTGTNGLTKSGADSLVLNNTSNNVTGRLTINQGLVSFSNPAVLANFTDIHVGTQTVSSPSGLAFSPATGAATVNKPMSVPDGFVQLRSGDNATLTYAGQISGAGGVFVGGGNVELTNTANSYTGQTRVFGGNLLVGSDNVLGNGGGVDFGAGSTNGLRLTGDWTTSRQINFSANSQVNTNGFNWTVHSPLTSTGVGMTINKVGDGVWTLTAGGALGQSLTPGLAASEATLNVSGGELRATNITGSATGIAAVNINSGSIISGTGRFGGATTVAAGAIVAPGVGGSTIGTLEFGSNLTINGRYTANLSSTVGDQINVAGAVSLGGGSILDLSGGTLNPTTTFTLMSFSSLTGSFAAVNGLPASHNLVYNPTSLQLVPVPEPTLILAVSAGVLLAGRQIRRRKKFPR